MIKLVLSGAGGRMCRVIAALVAEKPQQFKVVGGVDKSASDLNFPVVENPSNLVGGCDVIIDFSNPSLLDSLLEYSVNNKTPLVLATTGYSQEQIEKIKLASEKTAIFFSANMSLGINLLVELAKKASMVLGLDYDIEIIEKHHNQKVDSPSGTAMLLASEINSVNNDQYDYVYDRSNKREARSKTEIGIHGVRGGTIVGEHDILFAGKDEVITLSHTAYSRDVFATGALKAAEFIAGKPAGLYSMKDLI